MAGATKIVEYARISSTNLGGKTMTVEEELNELREKVKSLEAELKKEREKKAKKEEEEEESRLTDTLETSRDEFSKLYRAGFYAGLEWLSLAADMTRTFIDKVYERNSPEKRDTVTERITHLPVDMVEAFVDALDDTVEKADRVVDKFRDKYKEK